MKARNIFLIVSLLGMFAQPPLLRQKSKPTASPALSASKQVWRTYTRVNFIRALAIQRDNLWAVTDVGVVRWNITDGSSIKYTADDGLPSNSIVAGIARDPAGNPWTERISE